MAPRVIRKRNPRRPKRPAKKLRKSKSVAQYATIQETIKFEDLTSSTNLALVFNLSQFARASELARNFRWYKAAKVSWTLEPLFNSFIDTSATTDTIPYLYKLMDRTQDNLSMTLADFQASGAKPSKLTSKKVLTYVPNWCSPGLTSYLSTPTNPLSGINSQGLKAEFAYLASPDDSNLAADIPQYMTPLDTRDPTIPTNTAMVAINVNQVTYNGMDIYIDQATNQGEPIVARLIATVTWLFKDPKFHGFVRESQQVRASAT